jgi:hypothetical protein
MAVRVNDKCGYVSGNHGQFSGGHLVSTPIDTNAVAVVSFSENTYAF